MDIVLYTSEQDAVDKLTYYTDPRHADEAEAIAKSGQAKVMMHHTAKARAAQFYELARLHLQQGTHRRAASATPTTASTSVAVETDLSPATVPSHCLRVHMVGSDGAAVGDVDGQTPTVCCGSAGDCNVFALAAELCLRHESFVALLPCVRSVARSMSERLCQGAAWCPPEVPTTVPRAPPVWL